MSRSIHRRAGQPSGQRVTTTVAAAINSLHAPHRVNLPAPLVATHRPSAKHLRAVPAPRRVAYRRERLELDDGDFVDLDWADATDAAQPLLVFFHGLEGSSDSQYCRNTMA